MSMLSRRQIMQLMAGSAWISPEVSWRGASREDVEIGRSPLAALADLVPLREGDQPGDSFPLMTAFINPAAAMEFGNLGAEATYIQRSASIPHAETYIPSYAAWEMWPEGWEAFFGFSPAVLETALAQPQALEGFQLFGGTFDRRELIRTWEANGFKPDATVSDVWAFAGSDDEWYALLEQIDLNPFLSGVGRGLALPYDNVVAVSDPALLVRCLAVAARDDRAMTAAGAPEVLLRTDTWEFSEAMMVPGERFLNTGFATNPNLTADQREEAMEFEVALRDRYGPTPVVDGVLLAATPGAPYRPAEVEGLPPDPAIHVAVVSLQERDAAPVFLDMALARFEQHLSLVRRVPFTELLELTSATVEPAGSVRLEFRQVGESRFDLIDLFGASDLAFLQHEGGRRT